MHQLASTPGNNAYSYTLNLMDILFPKHEMSAVSQTLIKEKNPILDEVRVNLLFILYNLFIGFHSTTIKDNPQKN